MPPVISDVHVDRLLTNTCQKFLLPEVGFIADRFSPLCPVGKKTDKILQYDRDDWFRDDAQVRAPGTQGRRGGFKIDTSETYSCEEYVWGMDIPDELRNNADQPIDLDMDAAQISMQILKIRRERMWAEKFFAADLWTNEYTGGADFTKWSTYATSDPLVDVRTARSAVLSNTGFLPNKMAMSWNVFSYLQNHPDITDRYKYTSGGPITADMIARLFDVDEILIGQSVYTATAPGVDPQTYSFVLPDYVLLGYVQPSPSLIRPSAGYVYSWRGGAEEAGIRGVGMVVRKYRFTTGERKDVVEVAIYEDHKLIEPDLGAILLDVV